ncbi:hypothetical protein [Kitasatospora sp. NPDC088346]|uniref:hypothetical protein n=1 Tax=Kitasatospora sp. NPDC088346 TaxID=3364073 RepID=UPI00381EE846
MSEPVRIAPGSFGAAEATGADQRARNVLARLGFAPPHDAEHPLALQGTDGPLVLRALVGEGARLLERAGYRVEVDPELRLAPAGEQALEVLAEIAARLGELTALVESMDDVRDLADIGAQMVTGPYSTTDALHALFTSGAQTSLRAGGSLHERADLQAWHLDGAAHTRAIATAAAATGYPPPAATEPRVRAARTRSPAARASTAVPVTSATATEPAPSPRRTRA